MTAPGSLQPRSASDTQGDTGRVLEKLEQSGKVNDLMKLLANSDNGFRPFVLMSDALLVRATLPAKVREVVVLYMAAQRNVAYQWHEHVEMSRREGITSAQHDALRHGDIDDALLFSAGQRLALRVSAQILDGHALTLETWNEMCREWTQAGALDLILTIGWWGGFVPMVINAVLAHGLSDKPIS